MDKKNFKTLKPCVFNPGGESFHSCKPFIKNNWLTKSLHNTLGTLYLPPAVKSHQISIHLEIFVQRVSALHRRHQNTKWEKIFCKNSVHPFSLSFISVFYLRRRYWYYWSALPLLTVASVLGVAGADSGATDYTHDDTHHWVWWEFLFLPSRMISKNKKTKTLCFFFFLHHKMYIIAYWLFAD